MELVLIYLWLKIDSVITLFGVVSVLASITAIAITIFTAAEDEQDEEIGSLIKWRHGSYIAASIAIAACILLPSAKDIAILVGASYAIDIAKSPEGQKVQSLIRVKANEMLDEELSKLKEQKK